MFIRRPPDLRFSDITPKSLYLRRREFLQTAAGAAIGAAAATLAPQLTAHVNAAPQREGTGHGAKLPNVVKSPLSTTDEKINSWKTSPLQQLLRVRPRQGRSGRERRAPQAAPVDGRRRRRVRQARRRSTSTTSSSRYPLEERIYRMRCVEAWSMVIPWVGLPARRPRQAPRADDRRRSTSSSRRCSIRSRCPASAARC